MTAKEKKKLEPIKFTVEAIAQPPARFKITVYDDVLKKVLETQGTDILVNINRTYRQLYIPLSKKIKNYNDRKDAEYHLKLYTCNGQIFVNKNPIEHPKL